MSDREARLAAFDRDRAEGGRLLLAGVDEAGRGCLAGPVVAAAVILPADWVPEGLDDSKRLAPARRARLDLMIREGALAWGVFSVSAAEIDRINILQASLAAMAGAVAALAPAPDRVLVDGNRLPAWERDAEAVIGGDRHSAAVAAASILAKVARDRTMVDLDGRHPGYGFAGNKGYGSPDHLEALRRLGPCPEHRRSYRPVAETRQGRIW